MPGKKSTPVSLQASETALFNCIKKHNAEGLAAMLLDTTVNPDTGESSVTPKSQVNVLVNALGPKKLTPLSFAVSQGADDEILHTLLLAGAKINAKDGTKEQSTALHTACWGEHDIATQLLLRCGADPVVKDAEGRTPLHILASLNARNLFVYFIEAVTVPTERQEGFLYLDGHPPVVLDLFDLLGRRDASGFTVLHTAVAEVSSGSDAVITDVLDVLEAKVTEKPETVRNFVNNSTESRSTALHLLLGAHNCHEGHVVEVLNRLLALGSSVTSVDEFGQTPITVAVLMQTASTTAGTVLKTLLQFAQKEAETKGKSDGNEILGNLFTMCDDTKGYALIHHAIAANNIGAIKAMIAFLSAKDKVYVREWMGEVHTAEHVSVTVMLASRQCDDIARILIEADAISRDAYKESCAAYELAAEKTRNTVEEEIASKKTEIMQEDESTIASGRGDFSGFGAVSTGSRVQNSRKAKAQAAQKRRENQSKRDESHSTSEKVPLWVSVLGALFALSMLLSGYLMIKEK